MNRFRKERREYERIALNLPVRYASQGIKGHLVNNDEKEHLAKTVDLSEGGVGLIINHYISITTRVTLKFIKTNILNPQENRHIILAGRVSHITPLNNTQFRIGVCFGMVNEQIREKYFDIICLSEK